MIKPLFIATVGMVIAAGCTPFGGSEGSLGHGEFFYQCVGNGDIACDDEKASSFDFELTSADGSKLPRALAVGAPFEMVFQGNVDGNVTDTVIQASSPRLAPHSDIGFAIVEPATVSFLAVRGGGRVSDFIDVTAENVDTLAAFHSGALVSKLTMNTGDGKDIGAFARGASGKPLSGALVWGWSSSDETVFVLDTGASDLQSNEVTIRAIGPGSATLTVKVDGQSLDIPITVAD